MTPLDAPWYHSCRKSSAFLHLLSYAGSSVGDSLHTPFLPAD